MKYNVRGKSFNGKLIKILGFFLLVFWYYEKRGKKLHRLRHQCHNFHRFWFILILLFSFSSLFHIQENKKYLVSVQLSEVSEVLSVVVDKSYIIKYHR